MTWQFIVAIIALIADAIFGAMDALITDRGIRKGLGIEGNSWITGLWRTTRPKLWQLFVFNWLQCTVLGSFAIAGGFVADPYTSGIFFFMSAVGWYVDTAKHIIGWHSWKRLGA